MVRLYFMVRAFYSLPTIHDKFRKYIINFPYGFRHSSAAGEACLCTDSFVSYSKGACHSSVFACKYTTLYFFGGVNGECLLDAR